MLDAFPGGIPEPEVVVVGDDHMAWHFMEGLVQVYDMLGAWEDLNPVVEQEWHGWTAIQQFSGGFAQAIMAGYDDHPDWAGLTVEERLITVRPWIRGAGAVVARALAGWLFRKQIDRIFLWVMLEGHGFRPFVVEARDPDDPQTMFGGCVSAT